MGRKGSGEKKREEKGNLMHSSFANLRDLQVVQDIWSIINQTLHQNTLPFHLRITGRL